MSISTALVADEIDLARSREYALLSQLLLSSPPRELLEKLAALPQDPTPLGRAHASLAEAAGKADAKQIEREYFNLFIGVGRGELLPYASFYLTGSLYGRPLSELRQSLTRLGIERVSTLQEPEDHAGVLCEILAALADRSLDASPEASREFFVAHVANWMGRFFADLERAKSANWYAHVGRIGRQFLEIEIQALRLPG